VMPKPKPRSVKDGVTNRYRLRDLLIAWFSSVSSLFELPPASEFTFTVIYWCADESGSKTHGISDFAVL
jgi:hypothetical protein